MHIQMYLTGNSILSQAVNPMAVGMAPWLYFQSPWHHHRHTRKNKLPRHADPASYLPCNPRCVLGATVSIRCICLRWRVA